MQYKGSRRRCLELTSRDRDETAHILTSLTEGKAVVTAAHRWMPRGLEAPEEALLRCSDGLLPPPICCDLENWWLARKPKSETGLPNWDIASTCTVDGTNALLLVEAKAHVAELGEQDCTKAVGPNKDSIEAALGEASMALTAAVGHSFDLRIGDHYQLSNRFAWSWKIAALGWPVVLVYLGFLNVGEMPEPLLTQTDWECRLRAYAQGVVPNEAWGSEIKTNAGASVHPLISSVELEVQ